MELKGVLITGVYGTGKTSVVEELAEMLEDAEVSYGAMELDWLMWFDAEIEDDDREKVFLANTSAVSTNYINAGVDRFVMSLSVRDKMHLDAIRNPIPVPLSVVRLTIPYSEIEARLGLAVTVGRERDLPNAKTWIVESKGTGIEDVTIGNSGTIRQTAQEILDWLEW